MADCPDCSDKHNKVVMKYEGTGKVSGTRRYYCDQCGQHFVKRKGEKTFRRGQF